MPHALRPLPALPAARPFRSLLLRTVAAIAGACLLGAGLAIAVQAWQAGAALEAAEAEAARDIRDTRLQQLGVALEARQGTAVQQELDLIARYPRVVGVRLVTRDGSRLRAGAPPDLPGSPQPLLPRRALKGIELPVPDPRDGEPPCAQLEIDFDRSGLAAELRAGAWRAALATLPAALLLTLLLSRFMLHEVARPLRRLADHAAQLEPGCAAPVLPPRQERRWRDEFDLVVDSLRLLHGSITQHVGERDLALRTLGAERDRLETAVQQRTGDLTRLNRVLESASRLSARLIYLPPDAYPTALRMTLGDIAELLGARSCALAERNDARRWAWTFCASGVAAGGPAEGSELPPLFPVDGWETQWCTETSDCAESRALLHATGARSLQVCRHDAADGGQLLACLDLAEAVHEREIALIAKPLFGALARWRDLTQLEHARRELLHQSRSDALTGLANRRAFDERKLEEVRRAWRTQRPLSLVMIDIDFFKRYNDHYGHAAGDECLSRVARAIGAAFERGGECAARIGGEEFAVLLPDGTLEDAERRCERIRQTLKHMAIPHAEAPLRIVSVSMGIATLDLGERIAPDVAFDRLMKRADLALYSAKAAGRDTITALA